MPTVDVLNVRGTTLTASSLPELEHLLRRGFAPVSGTVAAARAAFGANYDAPAALETYASDALKAAFERGAGSVVYCDPNGSDANTGALASAPKQTLAAALAALPGGVGTVRLTPGAAFTMGASDSFTIDARKVSIVGDNTTIQWTAAPTAGFAVKIVSTASYTSRYGNWRRVLDGVVIRGANITSGFQTAAIGLQVGDGAGGVEMSNFVISNGGVEGFTTCLLYATNAWRTHFVDFHFRNGSTASINVPTSVGSNFGENMNFNRCMIEGPVFMGYGEFQFIGCSFDNAPITVNGDCRVYLTACHLENPTTSTVFRFAQLTHVNAALFLTNTEILVNALLGGGPWTLPLFYVDPVCNVRGLVLTNVNIPQTGNFKPETGADAIRALVSGTGRVTARGITMNANSNQYPIAPALNVLYNGDSEAGNITGWTVAGNGGAVLTVDTTLKRTGTSSFKIAPGIGTNTPVTQKVNCRPADWVLVSAWLNITRGATGTAASVKGTFRSSDGTSLGDFSFASQATTTGWKLWYGGAVAPQGTATVEIQFYAQSGADASNLTVFNFDDVLMTVT